jgi:apolipoprotein N-acyltransferase
VPDYLRSGYPARYYMATTAGADPGYARWRIGRTIGPGSLLLTGAVDLEIAHGEAVGAYNTVTALRPDGTFAGSYAKAHLVPYGEYLALRWLLEPLGASRLVAGSIDFIAGPGPRTLDLGAWGKAGIQICYEITFSGQIVDRAHPPHYNFKPSNHRGFGAVGPPQQHGQARMRAIEEGLPILRATTTGISAVIDARGVVRQHVGMQVAGRLDGKVPPAAPPTLFARTGNALALAWAIVLLGASLLASRRRRR